jgi:hypothetical protein
MVPVVLLMILLKSNWSTGSSTYYQFEYVWMEVILKVWLHWLRMPIAYDLVVFITMITRIKRDDSESGLSGVVVELYYDVNGNGAVDGGDEYLDFHNH